MPTTSHGNSLYQHSIAVGGGSWLQRYSGTISVVGAGEKDRGAWTQQYQVSASNTWLSEQRVK